MVHGNIPQNDSLVCYIDRFVTLFHMPLFFIISGVLFKQDKFMNIIRKVFSRLILPYVLIHILCLGLGIFLFDRDISLLILLKSIMCGGDQYSNLYSSPLWFCFSLASIQLAFSLFNKYHYVLIPIGLFMLFQKDLYPYRIDSSLVGFLFFELGFILKKYIVKIQEMNKKTRGLFLLFSLFVLLLTSLHFRISNNLIFSINSMQFGAYPLVFLLSGISGTCFVFFLSSFIKIKSISTHIINMSNAAIIFFGDFRK